ncbi:hypothetical protein [Porphyromonas macacae]|uniref:Uncharacterized protein n=1 Tax=Porphyromonas macacae TaxID=28115 RepID=A0A379DFD1_9PORP|nr:hypothetical protein [Porphyromonas macacae]SUB77021.1 Uncharacterised protein [Porphyromonas macacae]
MNNEKEIALLRNLFQEIVKSKEDYLAVPMHDLFVQIDPENGAVNLYDDQDRLLGSCTLFNWAEKPSNEPTAEMKRTVRETVSTLEQKGFWENPLFLKPLSVELVDDEMNSIEQLLFLDDDLIILDEPLLKDLNRDLNKFMEELLGDIK